MFATQTWHQSAPRCHLASGGRVMTEDAESQASAVSVLYAAAIRSSWCLSQQKATVAALLFPGYLWLSFTHPPCVQSFLCPTRPSFTSRTWTWRKCWPVRFWVTSWARWRTSGSPSVSTPSTSPRRWTVVAACPCPSTTSRKGEAALWFYASSAGGCMRHGFLVSCPYVILDLFVY